MNPDSLSRIQKNQILKAFQPLKQRSIKTIFEEIRMDDRINFDKTVLRSYGIEESILEGLYQTLISSVNDRVTLKEK